MAQHLSTTTMFETQGPAAPPSRRKPSRRANDLDGKRWLQNSISVWNDIKRTPEERRLKHPATFPIQLVTRLLESFTTKDERVVLDPFLGTGSTLLAARALGKTGVGFEISTHYINIALQRLGGQIDTFQPSNADYRVIHDNSARILDHLEKSTVDICITSPPYWDILSQPRSADGKPIRDYHPEEGNLGHVKSYGRFVNGLRDIFEGVFIVLKSGGFCIVNVMDLRKKDQFYALHMDLSAMMMEIGFHLDDIIIWDRRADYNDLRPLGFPSVFRVNRIHEFLLVFQKPKAKLNAARKLP